MGQYQISSDSPYNACFVFFRFDFGVLFPANRTHLHLTPGTTLQKWVPSHQNGQGTEGSWLLPTEGKGNPSGDAFITLPSDATLSGKIAYIARLNVKS